MSDPSPTDPARSADGPPSGPSADGPSTVDRRALLRLDGVSAGYDERPALRDVTFAAHAGERIGVLGPNGGGKTTLFRTILGELAVRSGALDRAADVAVVPQTDRSRLDFPVSALDVVLMGTISRRPWWRRASRADRERARGHLRAVGLQNRADATFGALSGGQRQRVLVARALARDARILLLDEPYTGLDAASAERLDRLIADLADAGHALLIATHDVAQCRAWDRVLCLHGRQVAFGDPVETLTTDVLAATYGEDLLRLDRDGGLAVVTDHHHG
ncbi:MAG: metal ABC transporter ATP-binding protein [Solirubrobacteraceae bacterium]|nr:metal ABC transporter ATP-binding protein [Solirubrobacteraceae bacterium]